MMTPAMSFPIFTLQHDPLTSLDPNVRPTPIAICKLHVDLYDNARANQSPLGGGHQRHLGLLMTPAKYAIITIASTRNTYDIPK